MIVTAFSVPDSHIGQVLAHDLLAKHAGQGLYPIAVPVGVKIGMTEQFEATHPEEAILVKAANILILRG